MFAVSQRIGTLLSRLFDRLFDWLLPGSCHYLGGNQVLPAPLDRETEQEVFRRLSTGDPEARRLLIEHNLRLVIYIARKFESTGVGLEDLISIGSIGLIKAVNTFCPEKNIKLATYASRCIENEILMHLRKIQNQRGEVSIDEPLNTDWDGNELMLSDILGTEPDITSRPIEESAEQALLLSAVDRLSDRERQIMHLRFGLRGGTEHTQKEVADAIGISQSYISRLEKRILSRCARSSATSACEKALSVRMEQAGLSCVILPSLGERQAVLASPPSSAHVPPGRRRSRRPSASGPASSDSPAWARPAPAASPAGGASHTAPPR